MAQALLNNLTKTEKDIYSANNNLQDICADNNFEKILDSKTKDIIDYHKQQNSEKAGDDDFCETNSKESAGDSNKTEDTAKKTNIQDTKEEKSTYNTQQNESETLSSVIEESTLTAAIEIAADSITENFKEQIKEQITKKEEENKKSGDVSESEKNTDTEENDIETDTKTDTNTNVKNTTTITNEDPTMNKQLQASLENPTTLFILQAQANLKTQNENSASKNAEISTERPVLVSDKTEIAEIEKFTLIEPAKTTQKETTQNQKTLKDIVSEKILKELNVESVSSTGGGEETADNLMQYQTPQEQAVKIMLHGDIKFDEIKNISMQNQVKQAEASTGRILEQITKQMEGMYNTSKVNIVLNPASLGKVILQLVNSKEGLIANFTVTNTETQNALIKGLNGLKESLLAQGISVDNIVIKLSESESNENEQNKDWTENQNSREDNKGQGSRKQKQEKKNFEQMMFEINQE